MSDGQVHLVVGGAGGIGCATALELDRRGAHVALFGRNLDRLRSVAERFSEAARPLRLFGDAANRADVERAVASTISQWGRLDGVVLAVGLGLLKLALELTDEDLDRLLKANLKTAFVICQVAGRAMVERGGGTVVAIPGILGRTAMRSAAGYCAAKHALVGLLKGMALDLQRQNVRFSLLYFGGIDAPF
jgi:NAD(P)-dependent dehydrogenase (short-subunit alcohol dehydrogenase family)